MRYARIVINVAHGMEPKRFVKPQRVGLCTEFNAGDASLYAKALHSVADQGRANPAPPCRGQHANAANLAQIALHQQAGRPDGVARLTCQKVYRHFVQIVQLVSFRHALFVDKHRAAQGAARCDVAGFCNRHGHAK